VDVIVLLGAPGSGKGTVAEDIRSAVNYQHISTGDVLRNAILTGKNNGEKLRSYMERGELVPDNLIIPIVSNLIQSASKDSRFMFDGFPRTNAQAEKLDEILLTHKANVKFVFLLEVAHPVLIKRICGRRICRSCGAVYNIHTKKPKVDGVCDLCGSHEIYQRADDTEETLTNRLDVYERQTAELIDYYEKKKVLVRIHAEDRAKTEFAIIKCLNA
jgi:adenylate kinase